MKVILLEDVENVGQQHDIAEVRDGYARNYLVRKGLALCATPSNVKRVRERRRIVELKDKRNETSARSIAERLKGARLVFEREVGEEGKVFGSITSQDVVDRLQQEFNVVVDHRKISLGEPLRVIGIRPISLKLHANVEIPLEVELKKKSTSEGA